MYPMEQPRELAVGFIGLGAMGCPIAANLLAAGVPLRVWNRTPAASEAWRAGLPAGSAALATIVSAPSDCAVGPDSVVISMLANDAALAELAPVIAGALGPGGVHVCLSTVSDVARAPLPPCVPYFAPPCRAPRAAPAAAR